MFKTIINKLKSRLVVVVLSLISLVLMALACNKQEELQEPPYNPTPIEFVKPINFPDPVYEFNKNPLTEEGFALGRKLFYDGRLSQDGLISCASCHHQANSFADLPANKFSLGVGNTPGIRNTTTIINVAWSSSFFWDGNTTHLDEQPIKPIENPLEMHNNIPDILVKLRKDPVYLDMFKKAFGNPEITQEKMLKALSQFMVMCVSSNSKFDKVDRGEGETYTQQELDGSILFKKICSACHSGNLFTDNKFHTNGILPGPLNDSGRYLITHDLNDVYFFKTPSLRNVAKTAPYMHDGAFKTLEEVIDFFDKGGNPNPHLSPLMKPLGLSDQEKTDLIAFLKALTGETIPFEFPKLPE